MTTVDSFSLATPVLCNFRNEIFAKFNRALPGFNATTSSEVTKHLKTIEANKSLLAEAGKKVLFIQKNICPPPPLQTS